MASNTLTSPLHHNLSAPTLSARTEHARVHWLENIAELQRLGPAYRRFVNKMGDRGFFYEPERIELLWPVHHAIGGAMAWLWVERDGEGVGLVPLNLQTKDFWRGGVRRLCPYGKVRGALAQWYADWIIPDPADHQEVLETIKSALTGPFVARWDMLDLEYLDQTNPVNTSLQQVWPELGLSEDPAISTGIEIRDGFEAYTKKFPSKFLREIGREERKLNGLAADVAFTCDAVVSDARWAQVEQLHRARQLLVTGRGENRTPLFESPLRGPAFRRLVEWTEREGMGRHYWLDVDGELVAFMLGTAYGQTLYLQLTAMDDKFAKVSPTRLLLWHLLQREAEEWKTEFVDMGLGLNMLKRQFGTHFLPTLRAEYVNPVNMLAGLRCRWLNMARRLRARFDGDRDN